MHTWFLSDCNNQFVSVDYDPKYMNITCTFINELDISPKSCRVEYGTCDQETYVTEGNATDGHVVILLNSSVTNPMNFCYTVTASNATFMVMVKGEFVTPSNGDTPKTTIIVTTVAVGLATMIATIIIIIIAARCIKHGNKSLYSMSLP